MAKEGDRHISACECAALLLSSQAQCVPLVSTAFVKAGSSSQHNHLINVAFKWSKSGLFFFFVFCRNLKAFREKLQLTARRLEDPSEISRLDTFQSHRLLSRVD